MNAPNLKAVIDQTPMSYERLLIIALINSHKFYLSIKDHLCPKDAMGLHRHDFATKRFNYIFPVIATFWELFNGIVSTQQIPKTHLHTLMVDAANSGKIPMDVARELERDINEDLYTLEMTAEMLAAVTGEPLQYWMDIRIAKQVANSLYIKSQQSTITVATLENILNMAKSGRIRRSENAISGADALLRPIKFRPRFPLTTLKRLSNVLGGGLTRSETTMIAGTNGAGKTVMSCQMMRDLILQKVKVLYITTEQPPAELLQRVVSAHLRKPFNYFTERPDLKAAEMNFTAESDVPVIPMELFTDPNSGPSMNLLMDHLQYVHFIDWSRGQGNTVTTSFLTEIEQLKQSGFDPDVVILDWIGGGIDNMIDSDTPLRLVYQDTADFMINYGKRENKAVVLMAQFDKAKALNKVRPTMAMLSECKTMTNNVTNFIGITSLLENADSKESVFTNRQFLHAEKARKGTGGLVAVDRDFHIQTFKEAETLNVVR